MRTAVVLGLVGAFHSAGAFHVLAPSGQRRAAPALRSTAPEVGSGSAADTLSHGGLSDAMVAELQATAVGIDRAQQAHQAHTPRPLSQRQYGEVARHYESIRSQNAYVLPLFDDLR